MKVIILSTSDMGGAGIAAKRLHLALLDAGVSSKFLTLYKLGEQIKEHYTISVPESQPTFLSRVNRRIKNMLGSGRSPEIKDVREEFYKNRPREFEYFSFPDAKINLRNHPLVMEADIIHLHWVSDGMLDYTSFFYGLDKPVVWTFHDMNPFTGGCHHADGCEGFTNNCKDCPQVKDSNMKEAAEENLKIKQTALSQFKNKLTVITPSEWLRKKASASLLFGSCISYRIPNITPENTFVPGDKKALRKELGIETDADVILFVANDVHNKRKGIDRLVEAINALNNNRIVVCTVGKKMETPLFNKTIKEFGFVNVEQDMAKIYASADVFILPSVAENFPNTIIESLLCGVPVVASRVGGIPEQINETNGLLFEQQQTSDLMNAIEKILAQKNNYIPSQIRQQAIENYSTTQVVQEHIKIYKKVIENQ